MWFDGSLSGLSTWSTYCVQVVFAYLTTLCICSFIQNPRARVRMWGCFLFLTIAAWLLLWVPSKAADPVHFVLSSTSLPSTSNLHLAVPVKIAWASYVAKLAPAAWRVYALVLLALLLHLLLKSMQLRSVLRRTEQPSPRPGTTLSKAFVSSWVFDIVNSVLYRSCVLPLPVTGCGVTFYCPRN